MHQRKGPVDVLQFHRVRDEAIKRNLPRLIALYVARQLAAKRTPPKADPLHTLPVTS